MQQTSEYWWQHSRTSYLENTHTPIYLKGQCIVHPSFFHSTIVKWSILSALTQLVPLCLLPALLPVIHDGQTLPALTSCLFPMVTEFCLP